METLLVASTEFVREIQLVEATALVGLHGIHVEPSVLISVTT
jgi:hypothetical protein